MCFNFFNLFFNKNSSIKNAGVSVEEYNIEVFVNIMHDAYTMHDLC